MDGDLQTIRKKLHLGFCLRCQTWSSHRYALFSVIKGKIKSHFQIFQYSGIAFKEAYDSHCVYFIREPDIWKYVFSKRSCIEEEN